MTTYNTGNPVPSTAVKDLYDNSQTEDEFVNGAATTTVTRTGKVLKTMAGMNQDVATAISNVAYTFIGPYAAGLTVGNYNELFSYLGEFYKPLPTTVLPYTLTGVPATDLPLFTGVGDAALRTALAANTGAGLVGYDSSLTYAPGTVGYALAHSNATFVNAKTFGFTGSGTNADTLKLQAALDSGFPIELDAGTFEITLAQNINLEAGSTWCCLVWKTGMVLRGAGKGKTVLKLKNGQSTDGAPKFFNIISGNSVISNAHLLDLTIDVNGANNPISPNRGAGVYSPFNCAGLFVSGRVGTVGVDARMLDCSVVNVAVNNSPGVTCIATGQQEAPATLSNNVRIINCDFYNNGTDSSDHSSIYMWGNKIWVEGCNFDHPTPSTGTTGPVVAAEMHGSSNFFINNNINNYCQIAWVTGNQTGPSIGMHVHNNRARVTWVGVGLYSITPIDKGLRDISITGNTIEIIAGVITNPAMLGFPKSAILLNMQNGQANRMLVANNIVFCSDPVNSNIGIFAGANSGANVVDAIVDANLISGFCRGVAVGLGSTSSVFNLTVSNNNICNMTPVAAVVQTDGINITGAHGDMTVKGNRISGSAFTRGIFLGSFGGPATLDSLEMDDNYVTGATDDIVDNMIVFGRRQGRQARTITTAVPNNATWRIGDEVYYAPSLMALAGGGGTQYIVDGLRRMTNGTGNVLNTDWFQQRRLTGN